MHWQEWELIYRRVTQATTPLQSTPNISFAFCTKTLHRKEWGRSSSAKHSPAWERNLSSNGKHSERDQTSSELTCTAALPSYPHWELTAKLSSSTASAHGKPFPAHHTPHPQGQGERRRVGTPALRLPRYRTRLLSVLTVHRSAEISSPALFYLHRSEAFWGSGCFLPHSCKGLQHRGLGGTFPALTVTRYGANLPKLGPCCSESKINVWLRLSP